MPRLVSRLLVLAIVSGGMGCDVTWDFGDHANATATALSATLTWWQVLPQPAQPNVYMATATGTGCNAGYFGAQFHSDGSTTLLFSMWDAVGYVNSTEFVFQSLPASKNCHRNALDASGKSTGVQCSPSLGGGPPVHLQLGVPYVFDMTIVATNTSGAIWEVSMTDTSIPVSAAGAVTSIGRIFFVDSPMGLPAATCRTLGQGQSPPVTGLAAYSFLEYFAQPRNFLTAASWSDMVARNAVAPSSTARPLSPSDDNPDATPGVIEGTRDAAVAEYRPVGIGHECCDHGDYRCSRPHPAPTSYPSRVQGICMQAPTWSLS